MKIHNSGYEKQGWINLESLKPEKGKRVRFACITIVDWNMENLLWETTGYLSPIFEIPVLRKTDNINLNSKATHWKPL